MSYELSVWIRQFIPRLLSHRPEYLITNLAGATAAKEEKENGYDLLKNGYLSFQSNSHPIDFRKIEMMGY